VTQQATIRSQEARPMMGVNPSMRRAWLGHNTGHALDASAHTAFADEDVRTNIENLVGAVEVPLGIAGPLRVNGTHASGSFYVPFATTEGTLVSTYQYGMRAISAAGGANAYVLGDALDITPCFILKDTLAAIAPRASPRTKQGVMSSLSPSTNVLAPPASVIARIPYW